MEEEKLRFLLCEEISSRFVAGIAENADMAEIEESEKGLGDVKKEEVADTLEPKLLEEEQELAGSKLLPESGGGIGGQNFVVARQQPDEFGGQEPEGVQKMDEEEDEDEDEFDGPPPGWGSSLPPPLPPSPAVKVEQEQQCEGGRRHLKLQELGEKQQLDETEERREKVKQEDEEQLEDEDDIEGPPPGWGSTLQPPHPPSPINQSFPPFCPPGTQDKVEDDDDDDDQMEGPPPGWASPLWQLRPSTTPPHGQCLNPLPPKRAHVYCKSCRRHLSYPQGSTRVQCSTCQIVNQAIEERAQMVCGFCRRLLSYPQGSRFIQCSLCKQVNYVLQEHEVGQVKCENCSELLMYPNGAPSVRCTKCHFVTDVGEHNRRLPLSVQQGRASSGTLAH